MSFCALTKAGATAACVVREPSDDNEVGEGCATAPDFVAAAFRSGFRTPVGSNPKPERAPMNFGFRVPTITRRIKPCTMNTCTKKGEGGRFGYDSIKAGKKS